MELIFMHYLLLGVVWAILTFQVYLDNNNDGQQQTDELGLAGLGYTITWLDGDTSSVRLGTTDANGYITGTGTGTVTLETACAAYSAEVGEVACQSVIPLPRLADLPAPDYPAPLDAEIERLQAEMRKLLALRGDK